MLLASPEAAASRWVNQEIEHWFATRGGEDAQQILVVLTKDEGRFEWETSTAIPASLRSRIGEPRVVDLRWARDAIDVSLHNVRFRDAVADVALPIHGYREKSDLYGEDATQQRRTRRLVRGAIAVLVALLLAAVAAAVVALVQRGEARAQTRRAEAEARTALSRQLAAQSVNAISDNDLDLSRILALEAYRTERTVDARSSLVSAFEASLRARGVVGGPRARITKFAFSPAAPIVAAGGDDGAVRLWDAATGAPRATILPANKRYAKALATGKNDPSAFDTAVAALAFSRDGRRLAVARFDGTVFVFDVRTRARVARIRERRGIAALALDGHGTLVSVGVAQARVALWDVESEQRLSEQPRGTVAAEGSDFEGTLAPAMAFSPDSRLLAWKSNDGIFLWDVPRGRARGFIWKNGQDGLGSPGSFAFVLGGRMLAMTGESGPVLWDLEHARVARRIRGPLVNELAADPSGGVLAELGFDAVTVRDLPSGRVRFTIRIDSLTDRHPAVGAGGRVIGLYDVDASALRLWDAGRTLGRETLPARRFSSNVAFGRDGTVVALRADGSIIPDLAEEPPRRSDFRGALLAVSRDGERALLARGPRVEVRDVDSGSRIGRGVRGVPRRLLFDDGGRAIALLDAGEAHVAVWDVERGVRLAKLPAAGAAAVSTSGIVAMQRDTRLTLWSVRTKKRLNSVARVVYSGGDLAFSPDGRTLAATGEFGLTLYSVPALRELAALRVARPPLAFSPDSQLLATTIQRPGEKPKVRLLDVRSGRAVGDPLPGSAPEELAFAPDGRLVGVATDGALVVWDRLLTQSRLGPWVRRLCHATAANLTAGEWARFLGDDVRRPTCAGLG